MQKQKLQEKLNKQTKYSKYYLLIIEKAKLENRKKLNKTHKDYVYYENHHILPKSMFPKYQDLRINKWNSVLLTYREHILIHYLICKHYKKLNLKYEYSKMAYALQGMLGRNKKKSKYFKSRFYENIKVDLVYLDEYTKKVKQTKLERYGDENYTNVKKNKQTKLERYGDENYNNRQQWFETMSEIKENGLTKFQECGLLTTKFWKNKSDKEIEEIVHKTKQTKLERYDNETFNNREKAKETSLVRYGVEHYTKTDEYKEIVKYRWSIKTKEEIEYITNKRLKTFKQFTQEQIEQMNFNRKQTCLNTINEQGFNVYEQISINNSINMIKSYENIKHYIQCPYCNEYEHKTNYNNYHGENCIKHPTNKENNKLKRQKQKDKMRAGKTDEQLKIEANRFKHKEIKECPYCNIKVDSGNYAIHHGERCLKNPNLSLDEIYKLKGYKKCICCNEYKKVTKTSKHIFH